MKPESRFSIYAMRCPIEGRIKYVGSSKDLRRRYMNHLSTPGKAIKEWITSLKVAGKFPVMDELEAGILWRKVPEREKFWIQKIQAEQGGLLNKRHCDPDYMPQVFPINYINQDDNN